MTLSWIENEIDKAIQEDNSPQNVYDLAMLVIVRDFFLRTSDDAKGKEQPKETPEERKRREAVILKQHSSDFDTIPVLDQIENALGVVAMDTPEERRRARDLRTWTQIIKQKEK